MSGGHFDYQQFAITEIAESIKQEIRTSGKQNRIYSSLVLEKLEKGVRVLERAAIYAQRIDWLISWDDDDESFLERLEKGLKELPNE